MKIFEKINEVFGNLTKKTTKNSNMKSMYVYGFSEGLAKVELDGKWGYIDKDGNEVLPLKYDGIGYFNEGLVRVVLNRKYGYIDKTGRVVIPCKYDWTGDFFKGVTRVQLNGKIGYIDKTGKEVIPCIFDGVIYDDNNKMFYVSFNGKNGCLNQLGDIIVPFIYDTMPFFEDGQIKITNADISIIYNLEGEIVRYENI